jgi:hypothetical protein
MMSQAFDYYNTGTHVLSSGKRLVAMVNSCINKYICNCTNAALCQLFVAVYHSKAIICNKINKNYAHAF